MTQTTTHRATVTLPADDQILITREFDAPARLVWRAWTEPELVRRWYGGTHGEVVSAEIDLRVGGRWRYVTRAGDGPEAAFHGVYREIVAGERIVSTEVFEGAPDAESVNTLTLTEDGGRTLMTVLVQHQSRANRDAVLQAGMESGMNAALDGLERVARSLG
ncbi:MAG TPA: SRPBCC family protein [Solirubrobacteraceae bacterium]|nr:SRPBCC family protein [Solirubrobacteraceae bacterium]